MERAFRLIEVIHMLKIVATTIQDLFSSNVSEFLRYKTIIVSDMGNLNWQFKRLSNLERNCVPFSY